MKINCCIGNEADDPTVKPYGRFSKGVGKLALLLSAVSVAIAFGTAHSSTGGFKAQWVAPPVQSSQSVDCANGGWYHLPESPGLGQE